VFALEMGKKLSCATAESAGAQLKSILWYDDTQGLSDLQYIDPRVIVVDSLQKLKSRKSTVDKLRRWAADNDRNIILISQKGKHGASRHGEDDDFDCDMVCDVEKNSNEQGRRKELHLHNDERSPCADKCAHVVIVKSRVCELVSFDVPIAT
jgi:hypothetical protein